nr:MAG TPA: hypothetical protein [Caudoviricetes sp.]
MFAPPQGRICTFSSTHTSGLIATTSKGLKDVLTW